MGIGRKKVTLPDSAIDSGPDGLDTQELARCLSTQQAQQVRITIARRDEMRMLQCARAW